MDGRKHGHGVCWYVDSAGRPAGKYAGGFGDGRRHGAGTFEYADGGAYVGEFINGR
jgi:hypothetical protein